MVNPLTLILKQWDHNSPNIYADEYDSILRPYQDHQIIQMIEQRSDISTIDCQSCGSGHRCDVTYIMDEDENEFPYICCPECGPCQLSRNDLQRWKVATRPALELFFGLMDVRLEIQAVVDQSLWKIGKVNWLGISRTLLFGLGRRFTSDLNCRDYLEQNRKSLLFVANDRVAGQLNSLIPNAIFSLESLLEFDGQSIHVDIHQIEQTLHVFDSDSKGTGKTKPRKRQSRTAKSELIKKELIQRIRSARDYATSTKLNTGIAKLLPRPTQKEIAKTLNIEPYDVNRCLNDPANIELQLLWRTLLDVDLIRKYSGITRVKQETT